MIDTRIVELAAAVNLKQIGMNIHFHEVQMCSCLPKVPRREFTSGQRFILFFGVSRETVWICQQHFGTTRFIYSQLSRTRPPLVHETVVAHKRWPLTGTIKEISPKLYRLTNNNCYYMKLLPLLVKIRQMDKAVAVKTNSFWVLLHILCFLNALMNL